MVYSYDRRLLSSLYKMDQNTKFKIVISWCELKKKGYELYLSSLGTTHMAGMTSSVTKSSNTGWSDYTFLIGHIMAYSDVPGPRL